MKASFEQSNRMGKLITNAGTDELVLTRFDGEEHVNDLFRYRIGMMAETDEISFDELLGTHATVFLKSFDHDDVAFDGIVTEIELLGPGGGGWRYEMVLRPWLWLLSLRRKQQIYHEKTVVEIIEDVLAPYGKSVKNLLEGSFPTLEYTVQYRETDLDFVQRLMERFGISFFFTHMEQDHTLVLVDSATQLEEIPGYERPYLGVTGKHSAEEEHLWSVRPAQRLTTGAIRLTDYNFKTPTAAMEADRTGDAPYEQGQIESYDYPGGHLEQGEGKSIAAMRLEQVRGQDPRHRAEGDCATIRPGLTLQVTGEKVHGVDEAICLSARHQFTSGGFGSDAGGGEPSYEGSYQLMPAATPLRPPLRTRTSHVQGPQTATVVGDGEIDCDEYGRILVKFHWDLDSAHSMRCRVSQSWAGKGWGSMVIPRIGMEVVVEFIEGDPDQPLVTGCVYNGKNEVPYPLPANKTRMTLKSNTHQGTGFNELRFEDEKDKEEVFIHAQKDRNEKTLNNHSERIDNNWLQSVGHDKSMEVANNHAEAIGGNMEITIGPSGLGKIVSAAVAKAAGGLGEIAADLGLPSLPSIGDGNLTIFVDKTTSETIGISATTNIGKSKVTRVGKSIETTSGDSIKITAGSTMQTEVGKDKKIQVGKTINITVGDEFSIVVGQSSLVLKKDGTIEVIGKDFKVKASKDIELSASSKVTAKAASTMTLKGSVIKQN